MADDFELEIKRAVRTPMYDEPKPRPSSMPPVFVKVDRYRELLENVQQMRSYALGLRDALDAMADIEKEFKTAMSITAKALDKLNLVISTIDMKLLRTSSSPADSSESVKPPAEIEDQVRGIYEQIEKLKGELRTVS